MEFPDEVIRPLTHSVLPYIRRPAAELLDSLGILLTLWKVHSIVTGFHGSTLLEAISRGIASPLGTAALALWGPQR